MIHNEHEPPVWESFQSLETSRPYIPTNTRCSQKTCYLAFLQASTSEWQCLSLHGMNKWQTPRYSKRHKIRYLSGTRRIRNICEISRPDICLAASHDISDFLYHNTSPFPRTRSQSNATARNFVLREIVEFSSGPVAIFWKISWASCLAQEDAPASGHCCNWSKNTSELMWAVSENASHGWDLNKKCVSTGEI